MLSNHLIFCHPFSSCLQSFPASGSFPVIQLFTSGGQSIGASTSARVLAMTIQIDFLWDWLDCSPCGPRDSKESSPAPQFESINSSASIFFMILLSHPYMTTGKTTALTIWTFAGKVMTLLFYYKELAHAVMKAHKSQDAQLASWRPKRVDSTAPVQIWAGSRLRKSVLVWVQRQEKILMSHTEGNQTGGNSPFPGEDQPFVLFRPSMD